MARRESPPRNGKLKSTEASGQRKRIDDAELDDKIFALMDKQQKIKEQTKMEKILMPSNSLRSLYNDSMAVKVSEMHQLMILNA